MLIDIYNLSTNVDADFSVEGVIIGKNKPSQNWHIAGGHPWYPRAFTPAKLIDYMNDYTLGIGPCGLDKTKGPDMKIQLEIFQRQVLLAKTSNMPLLIHCKRAHKEVISVLEESDFDKPVVFLTYMRSEHFIDVLLEKNYYVSFNPENFDQPKIRLAFRKAYEKELIMLESGKSEEQMTRLFRQASGVVGERPTTLAEMVESNFEKIFNKKAIDLKEKFEG